MDKLRLSYYVLALLIMFTMGCGEDEKSAENNKKAVDAVLDDWHLAASEADFERYFSHFSSDSAIFMGTDATERWTIPEFKEYAKPHFDKGDAWNFTPVERNIYLSDDGHTAWFDEALDTPNLGPARGSGVATFQNGDWKIAHYNLSIPIPNAIADSVVKQVGRELNNSTAETK